MDSLQAMVAGVWSNDRDLQLEATTQIRTLLATPIYPPIKEVIQLGVVPRFVEFLTKGGSPQLQFEAAWVLTNIASGTSDDTMVVIDHGVVPILIKLLSSPTDHHVLQQAIWLLGNIAGDSTKTRDLVLSEGALDLLVSQLIESKNLTMLRNGTWTLSILCRGKPKPVFDQVKLALEALEHLVYSDDEEVLTYACRALSHLSFNFTNDKIQVVIDTGVCKRLVELLGHPSPLVLKHALHTIGNITTGDDLQTQSIINHGVLPHLLSLLTHHHGKRIKMIACWIISNITAGNINQIKAVIDAGLIDPLVSLLRTAKVGVKREAAWAISNATAKGTGEQIRYLVHLKCIKPLCDLLVCPDATIVQVCLEGLEYILIVGEALRVYTGDVNHVAQLIDEVEGSEKIGNLRTHDNYIICKKATRILKTYWLESPKRV